MSCEHIREMLMTDYHDGRLSANKRRSIDAHLIVCADCKLLSDRIYSQTVKPFNGLTVQKPDEFSWVQVKRRIQQAVVPAPRPFAWALQPVMVTATLCAMLIIGGAIFQQYQEGRPNYLNDVLASDTETNDEVTNSIEQYFL